MRKLVVRSLLGGYLLVLLDLTLRRFPQVDPSPNLVPFGTIAHYLDVGGAEMLTNLAGNLGLFVPLGLLIAAGRRGRRPALRVAAAGFALSVLIESAQLASGRRVADVDDVVLNTLGGLLGYAVAVAVGEGVALVRASRARPCPVRVVNDRRG